MADKADWRASLTATERYDNIQNLTKAVAAAGLNKSAFSIEDEAYKTAASREEYDAACNLPVAVREQEAVSPASTPEPDEADGDSSPGITIGHYQNCRYIASGVTAAVYRSEARALKVIVEAHNIAPHHPHREAEILSLLRASSAPHIIPLLETLRDRDQRLVLVFPYMPLTLAHLIDTHRPLSSPLPAPLLRTIFTALFRALAHLHAQGIIHRDVKPSAILLSSLPATPPPAASAPASASTSPSAPPTVPAPQIYLSDFGTAYHPTLSAADEPPAAKVLDVGTGAYRAPEALFGDRAYGPAADLWAAGAVLAECLRRAPLFDSRPAHEDGSQLGLVLSIFRTLGTPTPHTWPEALAFRTPPFEMYRVFEGRVAREGWDAVLCGGGGGGWGALVEGLVRFESSRRVTAAEALEFPCMKEPGGRDGS